MPMSQAASMIAKASCSVSPLPKNAGALPTPPKLPHPRPTAEIFSPVRPRFLYCTVPPFTTQVWMIEDLDISILYPLSSLLFASNCVIRGFSFLFVLLVLVVPARQPAQEHLRQQWRDGIAHNRQIG